KLHKISNKEIYKYNPFNPFNFTERIQIIEQTIKITKAQQNIQLLDNKTIKELPKSFKYIHFTLVQVTIKPLTQDKFMTKVLTREDANQPYWKEKFITGLPTLFAEKIKNKYREQNNGIVPYDTLTYGDIVSILPKLDYKSAMILK
ncbi:hypothetical protein CFOL_v3_02356, partial [Cephalotus follicularis]